MECFDSRVTAIMDHITNNDYTSDPGGTGRGGGEIVFCFVPLCNVKFVV